jgi:hypothetical protein
MLFEILGTYVQSVAAFWVALAGGGLFKMLFIGCMIYWIFCRPRRWRRWHRRRARHMWRMGMWGCGPWGGQCGCHGPCSCGCCGDDEEASTCPHCGQSVEDDTDDDGPAAGADAPDAAAEDDTAAESE